MKIKSFIALILSLCITLSFAACSQNGTPTIDASGDVGSNSSEDNSATSVGGKYLNTLTGEYTLATAADSAKKPVAITVNNISVAQKVQAGLDKADVVFETEVEGGITRLLALYADPTNVPKIGTVRSLRVPFVELAHGMNAVLFYHGIDYDYCDPLIKKLKMPSYQIGASSDSFRENNGLAQEHTLYTKGELLDKVIANKKLDDKGSGKTWVTFSESSDKKSAGDQKAERITVPFSSYYKTNFIYDKESGKYARAQKNGNPYTDTVSGNKEMFTNVFVLQTTISYYPDNKHRKVDLSSGTGYYASAGGVVPIKWEKGDAADSFKFTLKDGKTLTVNQGNSYVCVMDKSRTPEFK